MESLSEIGQVTSGAEDDLSVPKTHEARYIYFGSIVTVFIDPMHVFASVESISCACSAPVYDECAASAGCAVVEISVDWLDSRARSSRRRSWNSRANEDKLESLRSGNHKQHPFKGSKGSRRLQ